MNGTFTLDGAGNLTNGVATSNLNGSIAQETFSGTNTVNADCNRHRQRHYLLRRAEILALTMNLSFDDDVKGDARDLQFCDIARRHASRDRYRPSGQEAVSSLFVCR